MKETKPAFSALAAFLIAITPALLATTAAAQTYPTRPVEMIVPYPPGGSTDVVARMLQSKLSPMLGQPVIVDNRAGANGNIGTAFVAKSPGDGYRLLMATSAVVTVNPHIHKNAGFDPFKDFVPVSLLSNGALAIAVNPSLGVNTLPELIAYTKKNPKKVFYATPSSGTPQHLMAELLNQAAGIDMTAVHYKGVAPALTDVVGGTVQVAFSTYAALKPQADAGRLKIIAVAESKRIDAAPSIPTVAETIPGFEMTTWFGIFAPAGTPKDIVLKLQQSFAQIVAMPDVKDLLNSLALPPVGGTSEQLAKYLRTDYDKLGIVIKEKNITAE